MTNQNEIYQAILDGMAGGFWYDAWASWVEEKGESFGGTEITDVAPEPPDTAYNLAKIFKLSLERINGVELHQLFQKALDTDGGIPKHRGRINLSNYAECFGHYLVMQALGHGVSWFDDHDEFDIKLPRAQSYVFGDEEPELEGSVRDK